MAVFAEGIFPPNEFWDYSNRLYAKEGVEAACLGLQDRHGLDVNIVLFCCWVASSGRGALQEGELDAALTATTAWRRNVVMQLRTLRRYLKGEIAPAPRRVGDELRRAIAECELFAEHAMQIMLTESLKRLGTGTFDPALQVRAAAANLADYFDKVGADHDEVDRKAVGTILHAAFPDAPDREIHHIVGD